MLPGRRLLIRTASRGGDRKSAQRSSLERTRARTFTLKLLCGPPLTCAKSVSGKSAAKNTPCSCYFYRAYVVLWQT